MSQPIYSYLEILSSPCFNSGKSMTQGEPIITFDNHICVFFKYLAWRLLQQCFRKTKQKSVFGSC